MVGINVQNLNKKSKKYEELENSRWNFSHSVEARLLINYLATGNSIFGFQQFCHHEFNFSKKTA
jgi:hypothetical protein